MSALPASLIGLFLWLVLANAIGFGLMLADKTAALEDELRGVKARLADLEAQARPEPVRIEVPVVPAQVTQTLAMLAERAEALASKAEA